jgi:hypothetical protein
MENVPQPGGFKDQDKFVFVSIKNDAHSGKNANLSIDAQNATDNTPLSGAKIKQNEEKTGLYNLGYSPSPGTDFGIRAKSRKRWCQERTRNTTKSNFF